MNRNAIYIFFFICSFFDYANSYAQTLNPDTLVKYRVSKILTYKLDSTGQKLLTKTRVINENGLTAEICTIDTSYISSILSSIRIDTFKYAYDKDNKIISELYHVKEIRVFQGTETITDEYTTTTYRYKKFYITTPWSNKKINHANYKDNTKTSKLYLNGIRTEYFKEKQYDEYKILIEKYYHLDDRKKILGFIYSKKQHRAPRYWYWDKLFITKNSKANSHGDILQNTTTNKYFYNSLFKKPLSYSYIQTFQYAYKNGLVTYRKLIQPDFYHKIKFEKVKLNNTYHNKSKKMTTEIIERGMVEKEEIYEYVIQN